MLKHLVNEGYDHIVDIDEDESITDIARSRGHVEIAAFLENIPEFEVRRRKRLAIAERSNEYWITFNEILIFFWKANREKLHRGIRSGDLDEVKRIADLTDGHRLALAKNYFGRSALHIAVLKEKEDIVYYLATKIKASLRLGDNVCRV